MRAAVTTSPCRSLALVRWRHDGAQGFLRDSRSDRSGWREARWGSRPDRRGAGRRERDAPFADRSKFVSELARKSALFVPCPPGLEAVLEREIREIGVDYELKPAAYRRGVYVQVPGAVPGDLVRSEATREGQESLRRAIVDLNLRLRVATRVLVPLRKPFPITDVRSLYAQVQRIDWWPLFDRGASDGPSRGGGRLRTLAVRAAVYNNDAFINDMYAAQVCKDAIVDQLRSHAGERPDVDKEDPEVSVDLFVDGRTAVLSLDTSGEPLFKRGYRVQRGEAPLQESLAAGLLMLARYAGAGELLCDPMCGSGTILVEAAMMATRTPPSALRSRWAFEAIPGYTPGLLERARAEAGAKRDPGALGAGPEARIMGADASKEMVEAARANLRAAGFGPQLDSGAVRVERAKLEEYQPRPPPDLVLTNPPYGLRMGPGEAAAAGAGGFGRGLETRRGAGAEEDLPALYKQLGDFLKQRTAKREGLETRGCVFVGELVAAKWVGLRSSRRHELIQGGLEARLLEFPLYEGSRKPWRAGRGPPAPEAPAGSAAAPEEAGQEGGEQGR
eukprot:tig00020911_g15731.t1